MGSPTIYSIVSIVIAISSVIVSIVNLCTIKNFKRRDERSELDRDLEHILNIAVQYPYLEQQYFTKEWTPEKVSTDEKYARYDIFCNRVYNFLHKTYEHFDKDKSKIEDFVDIKSWIRLHQYNWKNPVDPNENIDGYDSDFRDFINKYIK